MVYKILLNQLIVLSICQVSIYQVSNAQQPLIVAHRGASYDAPENTLPAFELAWKQNADAIEGDFYLTKDHQIVCIHDKSTKKYCDQDLDVAQSTLAQLRKLDVGAYKNAKFKGTRIPTIAEVLATVPPKKKIYIEIKCGPTIIPVLTKAIESSKLKPEQLVVISFNSQVIEQFKRAKPELKAYWLTGFKVDKGKLTPSIEDAQKILKKTGANGLSTSTKHLTNAYIDAIQNSGFAYHVWTINDPAHAVKLRDWNVKSITTDRPALIRKAIESK